jgi:hypothetical protein
MRPDCERLWRPHSLRPLPRGGVLRAKPLPQAVLAGEPHERLVVLIIEPGEIPSPRPLSPPQAPLHWRGESPLAPFRWAKGAMMSGMRSRGKACQVAINWIPDNFSPIAL